MTIEDMLADPRLLPRCFECGAATRWITLGGRPYVGCTRYPKCRPSPISTGALARMLAKRRTAEAAKAARSAGVRSRDSQAPRDGS